MNTNDTSGETAMSDTTEPLDLDPIRAEALRAPWVACLADGSGWLVDEQRLDGHGSYVTVHIVRGSAAPGARDDGEDKRLPGIYQSDDHLVTFDDFEDWDEIRIRWVQAQAMVAGLNTAAKEG